MTDLPGEETIRVRRGRPVGGELTDPDGTDASSPDTPTVQTTAAADGPRLRRATYVVAGEGGDEATVGSTFVARRETRRRATRDQSPMDSTAVPVSRASLVGPSDPARPGRVASAPELDRSAYGPRPAHPVIAARSAPPRRGMQTPADGAAAGLAQRRVARRRAAIVVISASALVVGAAASLLVLALLP
jgi:hypothetical protein